MKNLIFTFVFTVIAFATHAQIICVQSFHQNDSIGIAVGANNLILNGGMENSNCTPGYIADYLCQNATAYSCDLVSWTCTGGGTGTYACIFDSTSTSRSLVPQGGRAVYLGNSFCLACSPFDSDTSCLVSSGATVTGIPSGYPLNDSNIGNTTYGGAIGCTLQQTVNGLIPGNTYVLEFWAGGETNPPYFDADGLFAVNVGFGNIMLRDKPTPYGTGIGTRFIILFNATATSHTISFTNWGHICTSCTEVVIDDVRLYLPDYLPATISNCLVGINEPNENSTSIFPNPMADELNVKTNTYAPTEIILYDLSSRKLLQQTFTNTTTINTEQLAKGMYIYELRSGNRIIRNGKVIKE